MPDCTASFAPLPSPLPPAALLPESASAPVLNVAAARAARAAAALGPSPPSPDDPPSAPPHPHPAPKKPRVWSAMFKRRPTTLAATAVADAARVAALPASGAITSQAEFRRNFLKVHRDRVIRDNRGNCFRIHPIMMNGDCGFGAIAKGINVARERVREIAPAAPDSSDDTLKSHPQHSDDRHRPKDRRRWRRIRSRPWLWTKIGAKKVLERSLKSLQAKDIRKAMYDELKKARKTYLDDCEDFTGVFTNDDFDKLEREVSHPGIAGHWLGTVLGVLEHVIVAKAMNINIFLYQFDLQRQCIRQFESAVVETPDCEVFLFFTGPASCGHFDTLVKINDPRAAMFMA